MPLWAAVLLFLLCAAGTAQSWRVFLRDGNPFFLSTGISLLVFSLAALAYVMLALLLVSAID
jgi:hypothetical protein